MTLRCKMKPTCIALFGGTLTAAFLAAAAFAPTLAGHDESCTALHEAAFMDDPEDVRALIQRGADINCLDVLGQTPLITAVNGASIESFDILLRAGADVHVRTEFGQTLLSHTKKKYASFNSEAAKRLRRLYGDMVVRLERAGARN